MSTQRTPRGEMLPGIWVLLRDVITFFGGWTVIFMEIARPEVREAVLILAGSAITVPGAFAAVTGRRNGTDGSPSQPQGEASEPSSAQ